MGLPLVHDADLVHDDCLVLWVIWYSWWIWDAGDHFPMGISLVWCHGVVFYGHDKSLWTAWHGVVAWIVTATSLDAETQISANSFGFSLSAAGLEDICRFDFLA